MLARSVILMGEFTELSAKAQVLYIFLNMQADDDGFVGKAGPVLRQCACSRRQLQELVDRGLVLQLDTGPLVVTHWHVHNQIRKDRYKPTFFQSEKKNLLKDGNGAYYLATDGCQTVAILETQDRVGEDRLVKDSLVKYSLGEDRVGEDKARNQGRLRAEKKSSSSLTDFENLVLKLYKKHCQKLIPCEYLCDETKARLQELQEDDALVQKLEKAFEMAGNAPFLCGENKSGWVASLDWLCGEDRLKKVLSGFYEEYRKKPPTGATGLGQAELEAIQRLLAEP